MAVASYGPLARRYVVAAGAVALAWFALDAVGSMWGSTSAAFAFFFPAIVVAAYFGRLGPALLATTASVLAIVFFYVEFPSGGLLSDRDTTTAVALFIAACLSVVAALEAMHRANQSMAQGAVRQAALYQLVDRLHRSQAMSQVYEAALDAILAGLGCNRASVLCFDESGIMRFVGSRGLSSRYRHAVESLSPWTPDSTNRAPILISDAAHADPEDLLAAAMRSEGISALCCIPLVTERGLVGNFMAYHDKPHDWSQAEIDVAVTIARQVAFALSRKRAEQAHLVSEERFHRTFANAAVGIAHVSADGRWLRVNDKLCSILGYSREELLRGTFQDVTYPDDLEGDLANLKKLIDGSIETYAMEKRYVRADGGVIWGALTVSLVRSRSGEPDYFISVVQDITSRRQAEIALKEADRRKDEFLATLAHELRNPLAPIRNAAHILRLRSSPDPGVQSAHKILERQLKHMVRLIDDLMDVSRVTSGKFELHREVVRLDAIITQALETARPNLRHELTVALPAGPIYLNGDPVRLSQVFSNLLNNAYSYTDAGGHVSLTAERVGADVVVKVKDNGIGIAAEDLPRLFGMFSQLPRSSGRARGLGIGLALLRSFVQSHGGTVEAHSAGPGLGSEFIVRLPALEAEDSTQCAVPVERQSVRNPRARERVLIVDDNRDAADSLAMLLGFEGQEVEVAYSASSALDKARAKVPAIAFLDLGMPEIDGFELARRFRAHPVLKDTRLVALTGWGQPADQQRTRDAGFDHHLVKPVHPDALLSVWSELVDGRTAYPFPQARRTETADAEPATPRT